MSFHIDTRGQAVGSSTMLNQGSKAVPAGSIFNSLENLDRTIAALHECKHRFEVLNERMFGSTLQEAQQNAATPEGGPFCLRLERKCDELTAVTKMLLEAVTRYESCIT